MNRRTFLLGLLAIPVIGPGLASVAQRVEWRPLQPFNVGDIIAATIETRKGEIADNVCANNLLLRHVENDWKEMRAFNLGDEVYLHGKVLVCVRAGTTSRKRIAREIAFLGDYAVVRPDGEVLIGEYLSDSTIWHNDHSRDLIRRMRATQRYRSVPSAWPFSNGV